MEIHLNFKKGYTEVRKFKKLENGILKEVGEKKFRLFVIMIKIPNKAIYHFGI